MADQLDSAFRRAADVLEAQLDAFAERLTEAQRAALPEYREVSRELVLDQNRAFLDVVLRQLRRGQALDEDTEVEVAAQARSWAEQDLPLGVIARSFQVGAREFFRFTREGAMTLGLTDEAVHALQDTTWEWAMLGARVLAETEREQAVAAARRDATRQAELLRDLAAGRMTPERLAAEAPIYGLDLEHAYVTVRAAAPAGPASALEAAIRAGGATSTHRVVQAVVDGELLGVAPQAPASVPEGATIAVGPAVPLAAAAGSFAEARQVLSTATAFGVRGVVGLPRLGPLTLVAAGDQVARRLDQEYFSDLPDGFDEVERTVLELLERDRSVEETAAALHLHRNTLRLRSTRFREATGLDVRRTSDLVTAWWLLKWRQARRDAP